MKPFIKVCESKVLRRSVLVCCGTRQELKRIFLDPKTFRGLTVTKDQIEKDWRVIEESWDAATEGYCALGFAIRLNGDIVIVLPEWDSRVFVHEAYHATRRVLEEIGSDDEELGAYIIEWLFESVCWDEPKKRRKP